MSHMANGRKRSFRDLDEPVQDKPLKLVKREFDNDTNDDDDYIDDADVDDVDEVIIHISFLTCQTSIS